MNFKNLIYLKITFILMINCSYSEGDDLIPVSDDSQVTITYETNIKKLISMNCTPCHANPPEEGAPVYSTYISVKKDIDEIINRTNDVAFPMPEDGLMSIKDRELIKKWKSDGLLEK